MLIAAAFWRGHPNARSGGGRWIWLIALGAVSAVLDEIENVSILVMLRDGNPGSVWPWLPTAPATLKVVLLGLSGVVVVAATVRAAHAPGRFS